MKAKRINIKLLSYLTAIIMVLAIAACEDDKPAGNFDTVSLDTLVEEANTLLETTEEGIELGMQQPGSKAELQEVLTWVEWQKLNAESQQKISDATVRLQTYIDKYKDNVVKLAIPWIHQESGTWMQLSNNVKQAAEQPFTMEAKFYVVDLQQMGYSNNMFASVVNEEQGFGIRYFSDGVIHLNIGQGSGTGGWKHVESGPGVIKAGEWMHISYTNNSTEHILYVNGVPILTNEANYRPSPADAPLVIGNTPPWDNRVVNALVKDFRFWSKVLSSSEVNDLQAEGAVKGTEDGLVAFFPLNADLGLNFDDMTGQSSIEFIGNIEWLPGGELPVIVLDYAGINKAIADATALQGEVVEGTEDGDYPVGTKDYLQKIIDSGNEVAANASKQDELDIEAKSIQDDLITVKKFLVADANGVYIDREDPNAVGLRITPNYTPQGDYTVEFDVNVKTLGEYGTGEFFNNGNFGLWVYGYQEFTEEGLLNSGGLWNFTNAGNGWQGPKADALTIKSGIWQHVAIIHDNTARTTKLYVDGELKGTQEDIGAPEVSGWGEIWLGNGWGKMNGYIKDFRLWDVARSESDLNTDIMGDETGLNIYLPLDKVSGIEFIDVTGNYNAEMRGIDWNVTESE